MTLTLDGLGVLTDLLNWMIANPIPGTAVLALTGPFIMTYLTGPFIMTYLTGWLFEGRTVHLIRGQSLSFFPGEAILILTVGAILYGAGMLPSIDDGWQRSFMDWWSQYGAILALVLAAILYWLMRQVYDAPR